MAADSTLRTLFRETPTAVVPLIGAVLSLFPEPFTTVPGVALMLLALLWGQPGPIQNADWRLAMNSRTATVAFVPHGREPWLRRRN